MVDYSNRIFILQQNHTLLVGLDRAELLGSIVMIHGNPGKPVDKWGHDDDEEDHNDGHTR